MANTLDADLKNEIVSNMALVSFQAQLRALSLFATDYSSELAREGDTVRVPSVPDAAAAQDKSRGSAYTVQDTTQNEVGITLDTHKYVSWHVEDIDANASSVANLEMLGINKGATLAKAVMQEILADVTNANYSNKVTVASTAFDRDDVADIAEDCDTLDWPAASRGLLLSPAYYRALTKDEATFADNYGTDELIKGTAGRAIRIDDFDTYNVNYIPGNSENLVGFAAWGDAIICAMRYNEPVGGGQPGSVYRPVTDPDTGLTLGYREYYDDSIGRRIAILECLYGSAVGKGDSIVRIVSA